MKDSDDCSTCVITSSNNNSHTISNILGHQEGQSFSSSYLPSDQQQNQKSQINHSLHRLYPFVDESKYPLPRCWNSKDKCPLLSLTHANLRIHYKGQGKSHKDAAAVRANHPIPAACGIYYFEIRIVNKGRDGLFGIGLSQAGLQLTRLPGWDKFSYGYHGDDGHSFSFSGSGIPYGPTFSTGDVIGCGLNLIENYCFYTKNGYNIGIAFTDLPVDLYPTVGLQTPGEVIEANFGQLPFVFDIHEETKLAQARIHRTIQSFMLPMNKTECLNKLVSSYLVHHGYSATSESFNKMTDQTTEEDIESIKCRERISKLTMSGRISDAIYLVQEYYPGLLERHKNLLFMLKCRQFIEMVAGNDEFRHQSSPSSGSRNSTNNKTPTDLPSGYLQDHSHLLHTQQASTMNSGEACSFQTKKDTATPPHTSPRESQRNSPSSSKTISNGTMVATLSSPRKYSLPQAVNPNILRHKSASPSSNAENAGDALSINNGTSSSASVAHSSSDVSFFSNGCAKNANSPNDVHEQDIERTDNGHIINNGDTSSNIASAEQEQNGSAKDRNHQITDDIDSLDDITPTNENQPIDFIGSDKNGFHCCSSSNNLLASGGGQNNGNLFQTTNENADDYCQTGCAQLCNNGNCDLKQQKCVNNDDDVIMTSDGIDCDGGMKPQNHDIGTDGVEKMDDDMAMDTSDCDEIITNNNAPITAIDANIALVHFGRELHQLSMQIYSKQPQSTELTNLNQQQQTPPKNGSSSSSHVVNNNNSNSSTSNSNSETAINGLAAKQNHKDGENSSCANVANSSGNYANSKELKMMQEAFSLMAYSDPWKSPVSHQLQAERREPVAAALNSLILEAHGYPAKPPLEIIVAHAQRLRDEMAKANLGAAACADPMFFMQP